MVGTADVITILRNVTGRVDSSDPLFTDPIMLTYLNNFIVQQSSMDVRLFKNYTWWEFSIDPSSLDPFPVDLQDLKYTTISDPAYCSGPTQTNPIFPNSWSLFWYQDPAQFYYKWPNFEEFTPQRPTDVLYFNNQLTFRGPPDQLYYIKIQAYHEELEFQSNNQIPFDYLYRYIAYGTALDIFSDYGEMDKYNEIMPVFRKYRALVEARTWQQFITSRTAPQW